MAVATRTLENFIGGRWLAASTGRTADDVNPADPDDVVARVPLSSADDAGAAIAAAAEAFPAWKATSPVKRGQILIRASRILEERQEEIARLITREQGKTLAEARGEVPRAIHFWGWMGYQGGSIQGVTAPTEADEMMALTLREPLGVVSLITPWNFPINIPGWKLASALVCGNTVVFKPAQLTAACGAALVEILADAGIPDGVVNLVLGSGGEVGDVLVADERVKLITFTGSSAVGWDLRARASKKRVNLELGNATPVLVAADADLDDAATRMAANAFSFAGQSCISVQRIYVERDAYDAFLERFLPRVEALKVGDPADEETDVGPLIAESERDRILEWIDEAKAGGADILAGGELDGDLLRPTVIARAAPDAKVSCQEVFGPVCTVAPVDSFDEAIALANGTRYGLQAGVFTRDLRLAFRAASELEFGGVTVNEAPTFRADQMPYGGVKDSGNTREGPAYAVREMTEERVVVLQL
jgi:acyl-CoA reductase-like NAD-dependent aldehyde dehydrogenase